jgi:hypothetical protein
MIRCTNCGTDNLDGSEYCDECGTKLSAFAAPLMSGSPVKPPQAGPPMPGMPQMPPISRPPIPPVPPPTGGALPRANQMANPKPMPDAPPSFSSPTGAPKTAPPYGVNSTSPGGTRPPMSEPLMSPSNAPASPQQSGSAYKASSSRAKLIIQRGGTIGKEFMLTDSESNIGRWDADGGIFPDVDLDQDDPEAKVSRRHARIIHQNGQYLIEDLGSTNGTFINRGRRLLPGNRHPLNNGDEIIVGKTFLKFVVE